MNANGEKRLQKGRRELIGARLSESVPYMVRTGLLDRYKDVAETGMPMLDEHLVELAGIEPYWIAMQVVKLGDGVAVTNRDVTEERSATAPDCGPERVHAVDD